MTVTMTNLFRFLPILPDDAAPQQREDHKENQRAPDDKVVDPGPVMSV